MVKVSNTMLAVIAALQGGLHSRRPKRYFKESALLSGPYPYYDESKITAHSYTVDALIDIPPSSFLGESVNASSDINTMALYKPTEDLFVGSTVRSGDSYVKSLLLSSVKIERSLAESVGAESDVKGVYLAQVVVGKDFDSTLSAQSNVTGLKLG